MERRARARLELLGAALLFSTGGAVIKATTLSGWQVACFRSGIAAVVLWLLMPAARRAMRRRTVLVALAYAATLILYVLANKLTTASNAIFLQSTAPLYLLLWAPLGLGERVRARDLLFLLALATGLAMFFLGLEAPQRTAPDPFLGNCLATASAATWALTVAGLRWLARDAGGGSTAQAGAAALLGNAVVFVVALPLALPVVEARAIDWVWIGYLGAAQIGLAYVLMTRGLRHILALEGALLLLVEPVLNTVWAWIFHDEVPGAWARVGALVILLATAVHAIASSRAPAAKQAADGPRA